MKLSQMFPSQSLDAADLHAKCPMGAIVTVEKIDFKTFTSQRIGEPEIAYYLYTREFRKPIPLRKTRAQAIEAALGTDETEDWIGRTITVHGVRRQFPDRNTGKPVQMWVFEIDMVAPSAAPDLPPSRADITGLAAATMGRSLGQAATRSLGAGGLIGVERAVEVASVLHERGRSVDDLARHVDAIGMGEQVNGKPLPEWSEALLRVAKKYCQGFPKLNESFSAEQRQACRARWSPPTEVVNRATGEVVSGHGPQPAAAPAVPAADDIPF